MEIEGKVEIKTEAGELTIKAGDLVTFPSGLETVWKVKEPVKKHYQLG